MISGAGKERGKRQQLQRNLAGREGLLKEQELSEFVDAEELVEPEGLRREKEGSERSDRGAERDRGAEGRDRG